MKTTISIEIGQDDNPDEAFYVLKARNLARVIEDIREHLRRLYKYEEKTAVDVDELRSKIWEIIEEYDVEDLIT